MCLKRSETFKKYPEVAKTAKMAIVDGGSGGVGRDGDGSPGGAHASRLLSVHQ